MKKKTQVNIKRNIVNILGSFGYLSCCLQWLWATVLNLSFINWIALLVTPRIDDSSVKTVDVASSSPDMLSIIFAIATTVIMLIFTVYVLIKIPSTIIKTGKKVVHQTADGVTPLMLRAQNKKGTKKNRLKMSHSLIIVMKVIVVILPIILTLLSQYASLQMMDFYIAMYVCVCLFSFSVTFFGLQYVLSAIFEVNRQEIW